MATQTVVSSVTGVVVEVAGKAGDELAEGAPIVFLESMKMEIPVPAPRAGRIVRILVADGDMVNEGDPLAEIE